MELQQLAADPGSVSGLFAKWAPSVNSKHDKATRIVGTIAALIFPTVGDLGDANTNLYIPYQQRVLSPLRAAAKIPEHFVGNGSWDQVDYDGEIGTPRIRRRNISDFSPDKTKDIWSLLQETENPPIFRLDKKQP